jgi:hypothetical protein
VTAVGALKVDITACCRRQHKCTGRRPRGAPVSYRRPPPALGEHNGLFWRRSNLAIALGVQHATGRQAHLAMEPDTGLVAAFAW